MKWIKFIAISTLICFYSHRATACADYYTPEMCNMFSVYNHNDLCIFNRGYDFNNLNKLDIAQLNFWKNYFGKSINERTIRNALLGNDGKALNTLISILQQRKNTDGAHYFGLMRQMRSIQPSNVWDYPTKEQLAKNKRMWAYLQKDASNHINTSSRLSNRYWLMAMRAAFYNQNKDRCQWLWNTYQSKYADDDIKTLAEGYLANYWFKDGEREKAREFYAKIGDLQSLRWCFKDDIQLKGIRKLYAETPRSVAFPYLIQDYVNSIDNDLHPIWDYDTTTDSIKKAVICEMKEFRAFAKQVINEGKIQHPALWLSASAYFACLLNENQTAINELNEAKKLKGTNRMKDNIRVLQLFVESKASNNTKDFDSYVQKELQWLINKAQTEPTYNDYIDNYLKRNHYSDALQRIVLYNLTSSYLKAGKFNTAAALTGMATDLMNIKIGRMKRPTQYIKNWTEGYYQQDYANKYFALLDSANVEDVVAYTALLAHPEQGSELEQYALSYCYKNMNYYNELIGTKYIRIEAYDKAITYLKPVSTQFIWAMNIAPHLHANSSTPLWYSWRQNKTSSKKIHYTMHSTENPKLIFWRSQVQALAGPQ